MYLLFYWKRENYYNDLKMGVGYHLNQDNPLLHQIEIGESIWAFTRNKEGLYVLAAELVVEAKTENLPNFPYGRYRVSGNINSSRYFQVDDQPSIEQVIRSLSIEANARILGHSFQGSNAVRLISIEDHLKLRAAARGLALEPRAHL